MAEEVGTQEKWSYHNTASMQGNGSSHNSPKGKYGHLHR